MKWNQNGPCDSFFTWLFHVQNKQKKNLWWHDQLNNPIMPSKSSYSDYYQECSLFIKRLTYTMQVLGLMNIASITTK